MSLGLYHKIKHIRLLVVIIYILIHTYAYYTKIMLMTMMIIIIIVIIAAETNGSVELESLAPVQSGLPQGRQVPMQRLYIAVRGHPDWEYRLSTHAFVILISIIIIYYFIIIHLL